MSFSSSIVDGLPLWALAVLVAAVVLLSIEAGWRLGNYRRQRGEDEKFAPISAAVGATLGLLAFLLAFTFGMAGARFDNRKGTVLQEANAIGTTYLRADFLPEPLRTESKELLREYTQIRAGGQASIMSLQGVARSAALHDRLWAIATEASGADSDAITIGLYVQSLNEVIDLDEVRITANRNRIPDTIWLMLCLVTIFSMVTMGYEFGLSGARSWAVTIFLMVVFTVVIILIADLDRPQAGLIQVSQQPLLDLLNKISAPAP